MKLCDKFNGFFKNHNKLGEEYMSNNFNFVLENHNYEFRFNSKITIFL